MNISRSVAARRFVSDVSDGRLVGIFISGMFLFGFFLNFTADMRDLSFTALILHGAGLTLGEVLSILALASLCSELTMQPVQLPVRLHGLSFVFLLFAAFFPLNRVVWVLLSVQSIFYLGLPGLPSAIRKIGLVLAALCVNEVWGKVLFTLGGGELIALETKVIFSIIHSFNADYTQMANQIVAPNGHQIEIMEGCSSFHNVSQSVLIWMVLRIYFAAAVNMISIVTLAGAMLLTIICNIARIIAMAPTVEAYEYWHLGEGYMIYAAALTLLVFAAVTFGLLAAKRQMAA